MSAIILGMSVMHVNAQGIGINATGASPDNSAMLDVAGDSSGILIPRINLAAPSLFKAPGPASYLMAVNTTSSYSDSTNPYNNGIGLYMNFGTKPSPVWKRFLTSDDATGFWSTRGNAGTNPANDYVGTSDGFNFSIRTNAIEKILVPVNSSNRVEIKNNRGLLLPVGDVTNPSIIFSGLNSSTGIYGTIPSSGFNGVGIQIKSTNNLFIHDVGVAIATGQIIPTERLDVTGNIYTHNKITYSEYAQTSEKTFKNEFYWDGTITANDSTLELFNENALIKFIVKRNGINEYFIGISTSSSRNFTCANNLNQVTTVNPVNISTFVPVSFTTNITGPNGMQTVIVREQTAIAPTYRFTIMVANNNVSVVIERWQN